MGSVSVLDNVTKYERFIKEVNLRFYKVDRNFYA